jgi:hypothetical protein
MPRLYIQVAAVAAVDMRSFIRQESRGDVYILNGSSIHHVGTVL